MKGDLVWSRVTSLLSRLGLVRSVQTPEQMLADRLQLRTGITAVTGETARRHSAVWASLRLRGDLVSTMPVDAFRKVAGIQVEIPKPPMLVAPGGDRVNILEWLYSSQGDLDSYGNTFGLITAVNGNGLPARIDLVPVGEVSVRGKGSELLEYRISGKSYKPSQVWHEKQYTLSGCHVGLAPIAYAAWQISAGLSAQQFAAQWFNSGGIPSAHLKNTAKTLTAADAELVKARFKASVANHDVFATGNDWEYKMIAVPANQAQFIEMMEYSIVDIARFFGVPADLIDAAVSGQSLTYANIGQRNLQFLIMNLGPVLARREAALSMWLPRPQFIKFNTDALLRMDPETRAQVISQQIADRTTTNSEARALENKQPLTPEEIAEFNQIYGPPKNLVPTGAPK